MHMTLLVIVYFMLGSCSAAGVHDDSYVALQIDGQVLLTLFLTSLASSAAAFWISAAVNVLAIANLLLALSFVFQMVRQLQN